MILVVASIVIVLAFFIVKSLRSKRHGNNSTLQNESPRITSYRGTSKKSLLMVRSKSRAMSRALSATSKTSIKSKRSVMQKKLTISAASKDGLYTSA